MGLQEGLDRAYFFGTGEGDKHVTSLHFTEGDREKGHFEEKEAESAVQLAQVRLAHEQR